MATAEARFIYVEQRAGLYRASVVHDEAIAPTEASLLCFDFADIAAQGCALFQSIKELNDDYRSLVANEDLDYEESLVKRIVGLYAQWRETSLRALASYGRIEDQYRIRGFDTSRIDRLRADCDEAAAILKEDAEWADLEIHEMSGERIDTVADYLLSSGEASS